MVPNQKEAAQAQQTQVKAKQKEKQVKTPNLSSSSGVDIDPRYRAMTCYNCGEPGHFVCICSKLKIYFMCAILGHYMTDCLKWNKTQPVASFFGSVGRGLGFYHIDLPELETTRWLNINNCGVVVIKKGEISMFELEKELSEIFCKEWPWQVRELTSCKFLVRFPPHKKVSDIKNLPSFNLRKEGAQVGVMERIGGLDHFGELTETWVQFEGIPPKWCDWSVFAQMALSFGLLRDVDWSSLFKSFYEKVGLRIACRNPSKIPSERLFELAKKLYLVTIKVEGFEQGSEGGDESDGGDEHKGNDDEETLMTVTIWMMNLRVWILIGRWRRVLHLNHLRQNNLLIKGQKQ
jgi:hypothetical protein